MLERSAMLAVALLLASCMQQRQTHSLEGQGATAADETAAAAAPADPLRNVYFGDLHLHTRNSFDAYVFNVRANPDDAYAYAKGQTIKHAMGFDLRLTQAPLDFLAVTDHAEYLGVVQAIDTPGTVYAKVPYARDLFSSERTGILA